MASKSQLLKFVRLFCSECNGGPRATEGVWPISNLKDVDECPVVDCIWHKYRSGKDPDKNEGRQEMGRKLAAHLQSIRASKGEKIDDHGENVFADE